MKCSMLKTKHRDAFKIKKVKVLSEFDFRIIKSYDVRMLSHLLSFCGIINEIIINNNPRSNPKTNAFCKLS